MATIPRRLLQLRDKELFDGETILWQGRPDWWADLKMAGVTWYVGVPWQVITAFATWMRWIDEAALPLFMVGVAIMSIPVIHLVRDLNTLFIITDRRAIILRSAWKDSKTTASSTYYERMDKELEILTISGDVGHLNFASGISTRDEDADHTGRYGFRCVKNVEKVRDLLAGAIARYAGITASPAITSLVMRRRARAPRRNVPRGSRGTRAPLAGGAAPRERTLRVAAAP